MNSPYADGDRQYSIVNRNRHHVTRERQPANAAC
jgi:hypothetical protein